MICIDTGIENRDRNVSSCYGQAAVFGPQIVVATNSLRTRDVEIWIGVKVERPIAVDRSDLGKMRDRSELLPRASYINHWQSSEQRSAQNSDLAEAIEVGRRHRSMIDKHRIDTAIVGSVVES